MAWASLLLLQSKSTDLFFRYGGCSVTRGRTLACFVDVYAEIVCQAFFTLKCVVLPDEGIDLGSIQFNSFLCASMPPTSIHV